MVFDSRQSVIVPTYIPLIRGAEVLPDKKAELSQLVASINVNLDRYAPVEAATGIPRKFIAALHQMECGGDFRLHLANGDPIDAPTVNEPVGIPAGSWTECAIAALELKGWTKTAGLDWDDKLLWLWRAEKWNGWGYRIYHPSVPTPYLWSGTNRARPGKYVSDGKWDATAVSQQIGCVAIWLGMGIDLAGNAMTPPSTTQPAMQLESIGTTAAPIGVLKIGTKTWLKASTNAAKDLEPSDKYSAEPDQLFPIYRRYPDVAGHYAIDIKSGGQLRKIYCYAQHASILLNDDPKSDEIGSPHPIESIATEGAIDSGDKKTIQEHLIRVGLLDPYADGKWGSLSQSAWRAFRRVIAGEGDDKIDSPSLTALAGFRSAKDLPFKAKKNDSEHEIALKAVKRMVELGFPLNISMGSDKPTFNIVYVSGTNPDGTLNDNAIDRWNDLRFLLQIAQDGTVGVALCKLATVDAGRYWRDNPMNPLGTAQVDLDQYLYSCHCVGRHGSRQYPALVQVGEISITRDRNNRGLRDADDKHYRGNDYGINQHHGYNSTTVGQMSAGCLVAQSIAGHEQFMSLLYQDRRYVCNNGYAWGTAILDGTKL